MITVYSDDTPEDIIDKVSSALKEFGLEILDATPIDVDDHVVYEIVDTDGETEDDE